MRRFYLALLLILVFASVALAGPPPTASSPWYTDPSGNVRTKDADAPVVMGASSLSCLSTEPSSPTEGMEVCADGDNWQPGSTDQGTDDWTVRYCSTCGDGGVPAWVGVYNITSGARIQQSGGTGGYVAAPTYSDEACTVGQWSFDASYIYICEATNQWDRYAVTFAGWSNPAPASCDTALDSNTTQDGNVGSVAANTWGAQSFTLASASDIVSYTIRAYGGTGNGNAVVSIYTDNAGVPGSEVASTAVSMDVFTLPGTSQDVTFTLASRYDELAPGTYFLVVKAAGGDGSAAFSVTRNSTSVDDGIYAFTSNSGTDWTVSGRELYFEVTGCVD